MRVFNVPQSSRIRHQIVTHASECDSNEKKKMMMTTMTMTRPTGEQVDELGLPWDLRDWIAPEDLLSALAQQLENIDWNDPTLVEFEKNIRPFDRRCS
jgi:hypothetical protein